MVTYRVQLVYTAPGMKRSLTQHITVTGMNRDEVYKTAVEYVSSAYEKGIMVHDIFGEKLED